MDKAIVLKKMIQYNRQLNQYILNHISNCKWWIVNESHPQSYITNSG